MWDVDRELEKNEDIKRSMAWRMNEDVVGFYSNEKWKAVSDTEMNATKVESKEA
jgi:hypothetical protein